ncbi:MAG TPA: hypothetical protein DDW65_05640 [Firmicutes bacterium]|nr:hypothetical protein [Bacillota bacterium]
MRVIISLARGNVIFHNIPEIRVKKKMIIGTMQECIELSHPFPVPDFSKQIEVALYKARRDRGLGEIDIQE